MDRPGLLEGKIAVVTGAASGIGQSITLGYEKEGAQVLAVDIHKLPSGIESEKVKGLRLDITDPDAADTIKRQIVAIFGNVDILVNNAGVCIPGSIEDQSMETWNRTIDINVTAPFRITQALIPLIKERRGGTIINVGSIMSDFGGAGLCAYSTSKHAIAGFTKALSADLGTYGITANYLQPGLIVSELTRPHLDDPVFRAYWENKVSLGRIGDPEDVVGAAIFLASQGARYITGAGFKICGGAMATV